MRIDENGTDWNSFWNGFKNFFSNVGQWINNNIFQPAENFFSDTIYQGLIVPAWDWFTKTAIPAVGGFFTQTIPDFWRGLQIDIFNSLSSVLTKLQTSFYDFAELIQSNSLINLLIFVGGIGLSKFGFIPGLLLSSLSYWAYLVNTSRG